MTRSQPAHSLDRARQAEVEREAYREIRPHPALRPFVDRIWLSSGMCETRCVLPDGCIDVMFDLARGEAHAVGTMTRALWIEPAADMRLVAARFRPGGALPFIRVPAEQLTDLTIDLGDLDLAWLVTREVLDASDLDAAAQALEQVLLTRLAAISGPHPIVSYAARALFTERPPSIEALERDIGWSRQHLARMFRQHIGVPPKTLSRVARTQRAIIALQSTHARSLAEVAIESGYFDQAHMARDFRELVGTPPSAARTSPDSILPIPSLQTELWSSP